MEERAQLLDMQQQMLQEMHRQNDLMHQQLIATKAQTEADVALTHAKLKEAEETTRLREAEEVRIAVTDLCLHSVTTLITEVQQMCRLMQEKLDDEALMHILKDQHGRIEMVLEFQRIMVQYLTTSKDHPNHQEEVSRLMHVLDMVSRRDVGITIDASHQQRGTTVEGDVTAERDVNLADHGSTIHHKRG